METTNKNLKKLEKYFIAGIDFMVDKNGKVYFIEANSVPGLFRSLEKKYKNDKIFLEIKKEIGQNKYLFIYNEKNYNEVESRYKIKKFKKYFGKNNCAVKIITDLKTDSIKNCVSEITKANTKAIIYTPFLKIKKELTKKNYPYVFNPYPLAKLTIDKTILYSKLHSTKNFQIPLSYHFKTKTELLKIIKNKKLNNCVIKPRFGQKGKNIFIIDKPKQIKNIKLKKDNWILQEKIEINKIKNKFYDIRALAINGTFFNCVGRMSKNPVVNVSLGGKTFAIDKNIKKKIKLATEDVIKQINKLIKK